MTRPHTLIETSRQLQSGDLDARQLVENLLHAIDSRQAELLAYAHLDAAGLRSQAEAAREAYAAGTARPLEGLPISIKDNFDVQGLPSGCGHASRSLAPAVRDAAAVARLRAAGACLTGKVQMHQYALGITGDNPALGTPRNPHDLERVPGGSSSGSAVSVAAGLALASLGSDTGGSVRVPAALCGLVGFKPSFGRIPRAGLFPLANSADHVGVLTQDVADAALLFSVLDEEATSGPASALPPAPTSPKLALLGELTALAAPELQEVLGAACRRLGAAGATLEIVPFPPVLEALRSYGTIVMHEAARVHEAEFLATPEHFGPDLRALFARGLEQDESDYRAALEARRDFAGQVAALLASGYDALLCPTTLVTAPLIGASTVAVGSREVDVRDALLSCTCPFSLIGVPALSLPAGFVDGLPVGLQVIGARGADRELLGLGRWIEGGLAG